MVLRPDSGGAWSCAYRLLLTALLIHSIVDMVLDCAGVMKYSVMATQTNVRADDASSEVERLIGLTQRQLSYWAATDLVRPQVVRGSGKGQRPAPAQRARTTAQVRHPFLSAF